MTKKTVRDIDVAGKRAFLRVDFNVPMLWDRDQVEKHSRDANIIAELRG